jgi:hypothetical protein
MEKERDIRVIRLVCDITNEKVVYIEAKHMCGVGTMKEG